MPRAHLRKTAVAAAAAVAMVLTLTGENPLAHAGPSGKTSHGRPTPQKDRLLKHKAAALIKPRVQHAPAQPPLTDTAWPSSSTGTVTLADAASRRVGTSPVRVSGSTGTSLTATVFDHDTARRARVNGLLFALTRDTTGTDPVSLTLDYGSFRNAGGANFGQRLRLVRMPACVLTTPTVPSCQVQTPVPSVNDPTAATLTAKLDAPSNLHTDSFTTVPLGSARAATPDSTSSSTTVMAASTGPSSSNGAFTATNLAPSGTWSAGGPSGDFGWTYPITLPPPAGGADVAPAVALSYDSGMVDGQIAYTNNQSTWIGEGWDYSPGYIERTYATCADDTTLLAPFQTGDRCWAGQILAMKLGNRSTAIVQDDTTKSWHLASDDGSTVQLVGAGTGKYQNEYWQITTPDGVSYFFGRNSLPGAPSGTTTNSAWTEPVYGAHSGQPCNNVVSFTLSSCPQAWRWNLDYVVDPHGNATAYYYSAETNYYGADNLTTPVKYTRGGYLTRIDYGLRLENNSIYGVQASDRVVFTPSDRTNAAGVWPDTPTDQECQSTGTCNNHAPTYWTRKRLTSIETDVWNGTAFQPVDTYALTQSFPTQGDPELELDSITRVAYATTGTATFTPPPVSFVYHPMDNRVAGYNGQPAMAHGRLTQITAETGQITTIDYDQTGQSQPQCTATTVPSNLAQNTTECFPVYWTPPANTSPILDFFHKHIATEVDLTDGNGTAPQRITTYTYLGTPAWHADDNEVVKAAYRTYGQFRGYQKVQTRTGNPNSAVNGSPDPWTLSTASYYRGMGSTLTDSLGGQVSDNNEYADLPLETQTFNGDSTTQLGTTISTAFTRTTTATRTRSPLPALTATIVRTSVSRSFTNLAAGGTRNVESDYGYDTLGRVLQQTDTGTGVPARCTTTSYADNASLGIRNRVSERIVSAQTCPTSGTPSPILADSRTYYDNNTTLGTVGSFGDPTRTDTATDNTGGTLHFATSTATFDASGRPATATVYVSTSDTTGRTTSTTYTPADGGPLTKTVVKNALNQTAQTTTIEIARGLTTETVDVAGLKTDATYDPLGRLKNLWLPGQPTSGLASTTFDYTINPATVTTKKLVDPGNRATPGYVTSVSLYDAFGTLRQTQADAVGAPGNRVVTDNFADSHGWSVRTNNHWYTSGTPSTAFPPITTPDSGIESRTVTQFDGAGRVTRLTDYNGTTATRTTTTVYGGDRTTVVPPTGGVEATTVTDARGNPSELDQWTSPPTITGNLLSGGTATKATYHYTVLGQQDQMTTAAGTPLAATWATSYDLAGRATSQTDPDTGTTSRSYDNAGELTASTDAKNQTLAYTYDALGRQTGQYSGSTAGTQLAGWLYDTLQTGKLTSSTRYTTAGNYTVAATGYDTAGNPTGTTTTLPAAETGFNTSYTTSWSWTSTHQMHSQTLAASNLPAEPITYWYDSFGDMTASTGVNAYVSQASFSAYGEPTQYTLGVNNAAAWLTYTRDPETRRPTGVNLSALSVPPQIEDITYSYDQAGNLTRSSDAQGGINPPTETQCYTYDTLDQLTQAWSATDNCAPNPTTLGNNSKIGGPQPFWTSWNIDAAGNRTQQTQHALPGATGGDTTTTYSLGVIGHAHALAATTTTGPGAGSTSYGYDANGNTTSRPGQTLTYTPDNHINAIATSSGNVSYIFDADGTQLIRHDPTSTTLYLPGQEISRNNSTGAFTVQRYYTHNGTVVAIRTNRNAPNYLLPDLHGTTQIAYNPTTNTTSRRYLDPYGNPVGTTTGTWPDPHGYLGKPADPTTSLNDLGAREYDPALGRFLNVDPVLVATRPQQANGYNYANNNPASKSDPNGLRPIDDKGNELSNRNGRWVDGQDPAPQLVTIATILSLLPKTDDGAGVVDTNVTGGQDQRWINIPVSDPTLGMPPTGSYVAAPGQTDNSITNALISFTAILDIANLGELFAGGAVARSAAETAGTGGAAAVRLGQAGEAAVRGAYDIGPKATRVIGGRTRIFDGLNDSAVSEVKNVGYQAYTQQLKDSLAYAQQNGLQFNLYVRGGANPTVLSGPLQDAIANTPGFNLRFIP